MEQLRKGDFVWFAYDPKEVYPGRIVDIQKEEYTVEICINKRKSSENELETVKCKRSQLKLRKVS